MSGESASPLEFEVMLIKLAKLKISCLLGFLYECKILEHRGLDSQIKVHGEGHIKKINYRHFFLKKVNPCTKKVKKKGKKQSTSVESTHGD